MSERKPTAEFWITMALIAVLVVYPLSSGPATWLFIKSGKHAGLEVTMTLIYAPLGAIENCLPEALGKPFARYSRWWAEMAYGFR
jgi:hypothetical protein